MSSVEDNFLKQPFWNLTSFPSHPKSIFLGGVTEYRVFTRPGGGWDLIEPLCGTCKDINVGCCVSHGHVTCKNWEKGE